MERIAMKVERFLPHRLRASAGRLGALGCFMLSLTACERAPKAPAPSEIRGEPINAVAATPKANPTAVDGVGVRPTSDPVPANRPATTAAADYASVGFDKLAAFNFEASDDLLNAPTNSVALAAAAAKTDAQIPAIVKAFNHKRVALKGFMLPLKVEGGRVTEMLILRDQSMCCYGTVPKINEWVSVKMTGEGVRPIMDTPVTMYGTLRVGELRENGYLVGIYQLEGEKIATPAGN